MPGCAENIDSFGAFPYSSEFAKSRLSVRCDCSVEFTGGFLLKLSNISADIDAPPDVLAFTRKKVCAVV